MNTWDKVDARLFYCAVNGIDSPYKPAEQLNSRWQAIVRAIASCCLFIDGFHIKAIIIAEVSESPASKGDISN